MFRDDTFQTVNNKGADQSARMRRLVCAFVLPKPWKTGFLTMRPKFKKTMEKTSKLDNLIYTSLQDGIREEYTRISCMISFVVFIPKAITLNYAVP